MNEHAPRLAVEEPTRAGQPFLYFRLDPTDLGERAGRAGKQPFINRNPMCVIWSDQHLTLTVRNGGAIASDLFKIEYQFRPCVDPGHTVTEGFAHPHAAEPLPINTFEVGQFFPFIAPGEEMAIHVPFPSDMLPAGAPPLANLYFRARVTPLLAPSLPPDEWAFSLDPSVVEATKRFV